MSTIQFLKMLDEHIKVPGYWYLATPYTKHPGGIERAFLEACKVVAYLIKERLPVFSPIAHTAPIAVYGGIDPTDSEFWQRVDRPMMELAHGLIVVQMSGWEKSAGVAAEIAYFEKVQKPVVFLDPMVPEGLWSDAAAQRAVEGN